MQRLSRGLLRVPWLMGLPILLLPLWRLPQYTAGRQVAPICPLLWCEASAELRSCFAVLAFCPAILESGFCASPPNLLHGSHNGTRGPYPYGIVITYTCKDNYSLIGADSISCGKDDDGNGMWNGTLPKCKVVKCEDPVVKHGIMLSGFGNRSYTYGNIITFECKTGYFLMGNYLITCEQNNSWYPALPSCKEIEPKVCGAPVIPSGTVNPLREEYYIGTTVAVTCNKQYSFADETMEMNVECQGYNSWHPLVQACFFRSSPDVSNLSIRNARIIRGMKNTYEPGDTVTIRCSPGYTLSGPSEIRYIGGKQWSPQLPSCYLTLKYLKDSLLQY